MTIENAVSQVKRFKGKALRETIAAVETQLHQATVAKIGSANQDLGINLDLIRAAAAVKQASAQIDVVIHAIGILYALPRILEDGEVVECLALGAANSRCDFDLVTDRRIAEFKFIHWQEKGNAVRNKTLFQDFFKLVREDTFKKKYLYLLETDRPVRFLKGDRDLLKVLDRNRRLADDFERRYGQTFQTVGEFYRTFKDAIQIVGLIQDVPDLEVLVRELTTST